MLRSTDYNLKKTNLVVSIISAKNFSVNPFQELDLPGGAGPQQYGLLRQSSQPHHLLEAR
jgi:hypothetical protein